MNDSPFCQLKIPELRLWVKLGYSEQEKFNLQGVSVSITFNFPRPPAAMTTDALEDTFCYAKAVEKIQSMVSQHQPFNLIEKLTGCIYASVYQVLLTEGYLDGCLEVQVTKLAPPLAHVLNGVSFTYQGFLQKGESDDLYQYWF